MKMTRLLPVLLAGLMLAGLPLAAQQKADAQKSDAKPAPEPLKLKVGDTAPDFTLLAFDGKSLKKYSLHDFKGKKNVALAFYVFAFTGG